MIFSRELFKAFQLNNLPEYKDYIKYCSFESLKAQKLEQQMLLAYLYSAVVYKFQYNRFANNFDELLMLDGFSVVFIQALFNGYINVDYIKPIKNDYFAQKITNEELKIRSLFYLRNLVNNSYTSVPGFNRIFSYFPYFELYQKEIVYREIWKKHF